MPALQVSVLSHLAEVWAYVSLGASAIITEELAPIVGGFAAHEGHLGITRVILACAIGTWVPGVVLYAIGRWHAEWANARWFPEGGKMTRALDVVRGSPWRSAFLVRFAFGVRIILPVACGVAHVRVPIFLIGSGIGAIVWSTVFALVGWVFGESAMLAIHNARRYEDAIAVGIVVLVLAIAVFFALRARRRGPPRRSVGP